MTIDEKIKQEIQNHVIYKESFNSKYGDGGWFRKGKIYTWSAMWDLIDKDLNKRVKKIKALCEEK